MLTNLPSELFDLVTTPLGVCDRLSLKSTCSEFNATIGIDDFLAYTPFTFTVKNNPNTHQFFCYNTHEILEVLFREIERCTQNFDIIFTGIVKSFHSSRFGAYITFIISADNKCRFHIMPDVDDFQSVISFKMFEVSLDEDNCIKTSVYGDLQKIPALYLFMGIKFIQRFTNVDISSFDDIKMNDMAFDMSNVPFLQKVTFNNHYSGLMLSNLLSSSVGLTKLS